MTVWELIIFAIGSVWNECAIISKFNVNLADRVRKKNGPIVLNTIAKETVSKSFQHFYLTNYGAK